MRDLNERDAATGSPRTERSGLLIDDAFMHFRLPGCRTSVHAVHIPTIWMSYGDALHVEAGPWSVTAQAVYVAPHWPHVIDGRGQLFQGLSLRGHRWPIGREPRPVMALSPQALHQFVDFLHRQDGAIAHDLAARLGFVPMRSSDAIGAVLDHLHARPTSRLHQHDASAIAGLERSTFLRRFRHESGMTFRSYKAWVGMQTAMHWLSLGRSASDAAMAGGFADLAHFSRLCRAHTGYSPRQGLQYIARATAMAQAGRTRLDRGESPTGQGPAPVSDAAAPSGIRR